MDVVFYCSFLIRRPFPKIILGISSYYVFSGAFCDVQCLISTMNKLLGRNNTRFVDIGHANTYSEEGAFFLKVLVYLFSHPLR